MERLDLVGSALMAPVIKEVLEQAQIPCVLRNQFLYGAAGELPPDQCEPELWILDPADLPRARSLAQEALNAPPAAAWTCPACGEHVEGEFGICWHCGRSRP